jgi:hypothetical protein
MNSIDSPKAFLQELVRLQNYNLIACGYEKLTVTGSVLTLASIPADARYAEVIVESGATGIAIRYLELGGAGIQPSTTAGMGKADGDSFDIHGYQNIVNFRVTQAQLGTHNIYVQYYK